MFLFSLNIDKKKQMKKFNKTTNDEKGIYVNPNWDDMCVIHFGSSSWNYPIRIFNNSEKKKSECAEGKSYEGLLNENILGKKDMTYFIPQRMVVIQMK